MPTGTVPDAAAGVMRGVTIYLIDECGRDL